MNFLAIALFQWHCILWVTILLVTLHCWWRWVRCCSFIIKLYLEAPCLWSWVRPHGIWKEICPVGAPNCRLVDFLRLEEFVILEISLWDQFGFKYGSCTMLWHNDTTWWCNYTPCNHQVHLNLRVDQLLGLLCYLQFGDWCHRSPLPRPTAKFAASELRPLTHSLAMLAPGCTSLTALNLGNELVHLAVCLVLLILKASKYAEDFM